MYVWGTGLLAEPAFYGRGLRNSCFVFKNSSHSEDATSVHAGMLGCEETKQKETVGRLEKPLFSPLAQPLNHQPLIVVRLSFYTKLPPPRFAWTYFSVGSEHEGGNTMLKGQQVRQPLFRNTGQP